MPLRPVSELGLVDITDVPPRGGKAAAAPRDSTRARQSPSPPRSRDSKGPRAATRGKPAAGRTTSKTLADALATPTPAKRRSTGAAKRREPSATKSTSPRRVSASTPTNSERPRSGARAVSDNGSGGATRGTTSRTQKRPTRASSAQRRATAARRQTSAGSRSKRNLALRETQRLRKGLAPRRTKSAAATRISVSVLMGASLVAGLLFARAALQR